jgi:hypothetical protein
LRLQLSLHGAWRTIERRLGIKFFQRVTDISSYRVHDPAIVHELANFDELRTISFLYSPTPPNQRTPAESEFLGAIKLFAHMNPQSDVSWPDDPPVASSNESAIVDREPFGDGEP